ncbi:NAD(P)-binding domain-containing protein [Pseudonocardia nematodicida]|uniref:NAD(P)-binding domain-containing protein n=1 Tax=Pseudonocardia nematodicida TaxID=1206997 RepID=A0ABV1K8E4_9PSEU
MTAISIIGLGTMARTLGTLALGAGHDVQFLGRDAGRAAAVAAELDGGTGTGRATAAAVGDGAVDGGIVVLAVPYPSAAEVVAGYGEALVGRVVVDLTNPFAPSFAGLVTPRESSGAQEIAAAAAPGVRVVKAFNTMFAGVLAAAPGAEPPVDVFVAGDDADAKAAVSSLVSSLGLRPLDAGELTEAHWLEGMGLVLVQQAGRLGDFSLRIRIAA